MFDFQKKNLNGYRLCKSTAIKQPKIQGMPNNFVSTKLIIKEKKLRLYLWIDSLLTIPQDLRIVV
jgi:hypothetical protein